ncbi:MAG: hypothetical protein WD271_13110 [Acidimicrobiia bacterium]
MVHRLRGRRVLAALLVLALSATLAATVSGGAALARVKQATGVDTATNTVKIAVLGLNLQALVDAGLVPDLGKPADQFMQLQNEINAGSKAGKYKLEVATKLLPSQPKPEDYQAACLWATEEQKAFAVVLASVSAESLARCIAIDHKTPLIGNVGFTAQLYKDAKGFVLTDGNTGMSIDRQMRAWAEVSAARGLLKKQKIGIVAGDGNAEALKTINGTLVPTLKKLGYKVTDNIVLPCATSPTTCSQQDVAVQRLKNDGVTFVFNGADVLAGATLVSEAEKIGYAPTWAANRNNTTDTVAKFFKSVADAWEGANGVSVTWPDSDFSQETKDCNANATKGGIFSYQPAQNAYAAYGQYCIMMNLIAQGITGVSGDLTQARFLKSLLAIGTIPSNSGPAGTWSAGKYDAGNHVYASKYSKSGNDGDGGFLPVGGAAKSVKVAVATSKSSSTK